MYVEKNTSHKENFLGSYHNHATVLPLTTKKGEKTLKYIVLPAFSDKRIKYKLSNKNNKNYNRKKKL